MTVALIRVASLRLFPSPTDLEQQVVLHAYSHLGLDAVHVAQRVAEDEGLAVRRREKTSQTVDESRFT